MVNEHVWRFTQVVMAMAIVRDIRDGRALAGAVVETATRIAFFVPPELELADAARAYVDYQYLGTGRPTWWPG